VSLVRDQGFLYSDCPSVKVPPYIQVKYPSLQTPHLYEVAVERCVVADWPEEGDMEVRSLLLLPCPMHTQRKR